MRISDWSSDVCSSDLVIGDHQVEHRRDEGGAVGEFDLPDGYVAGEYRRVVGALEVLAGATAEIGKLYRHRIVAPVDHGKAEPDLGATVGARMLEIPLAVLAPTAADRAVGDDDLAADLVEGEIGRA